jgi:hypothetical protein
MRYRKTNRCYRPAHTERLVRYWSTYINPDWDSTPQMRTIEELWYIKWRRRAAIHQPLIRRSRPEYLSP